MSDFYYHLNLPYMSGRVVRYRVLDPDEVELCQENGARSAGEEATPEKLRREQMKILLANMVVAYTDPNQEPSRIPVLGKDSKPKQPEELVIDGGRADLEKLKGVKWTTVDDPAKLQLFWKSVFNTKETQVLKMLYVERHDVNPVELQMILGKSQPVPAEG